MNSSNRQRKIRRLDYVIKHHIIDFKLRSQHSRHYLTKQSLDKYVICIGGTKIYYNIPGMLFKHFDVMRLMSHLGNED